MDSPYFLMNIFKGESLNQHSEIFETDLFISYDVKNFPPKSRMTTVAYKKSH